MAPLVLAFVFRLVGVSSHAPRFDDFRPASALPATGGGHVVRILAVSVGIFAALSLALWSSVWFAIQLH